MALVVGRPYVMAMAIETAVPAFIGYAERAGAADAPAPNMPVRIASLHEYEQHFGGGILGARPTGAPIFSVARNGSVTPRALGSRSSVSNSIFRSLIAAFRATDFRRSRIMGAILPAIAAARAADPAAGQRRKLTPTHALWTRSGSKAGSPPSRARVSPNP